LNLAVPILQLTEPGPTPKIKLHEKLTVTLWDIWEVSLGEAITLDKLFAHLQNTYELDPKDIFLGSRSLYSSVLMEKQP
jgi:hypothetical protein